MRILVQRVSEARVEAEGKLTGSIGRGYLILLGVSDKDTEEIAGKMVEKLFKLRIFEDENGKTNLSASDVNAEILVVSQFTLYADCKKGNRPSFTTAGGAEIANHLYEYVISLCKDRFFNVQMGIFGADMKVSLVNDGPFTVMLDSDEIVK